METLKQKEILKLVTEFFNSDFPAPKTKAIIENIDISDLSIESVTAIFKEKKDQNPRFSYFDEDSNYGISNKHKENKILK